MEPLDSGDEVFRVTDGVRKCAVSRAQRRTIKEELRAWYERGTNSGPRVRYNQIRSHIDRVSSYLFAPDTIRFGVHLPPVVRAIWLRPAQVARDEFRTRWADSGADVAASLLVEWALVYGATIAKVLADPGTGFHVGYIDPTDFGVGREDVPALDEQDTFAHWYSLSLPQIDRWLIGNPEARRLRAIAEEHAHAGAPGRSRQGLVITGVSGVFPGGTITGGFPGEPDAMADVVGAAVDEPVVTFVDLWERKLFRRRSLTSRKPEVFEDWLVSTVVADHDVLFVQRRNPDLPWTRTSHDIVLPGEHPFVVVRPRGLPDYFWGRSELLELRQLQSWLDEHLDEMKQLMHKQLKPPRFFSGVADFEEAGRALDTPEGAYGSPEPGAKMEQVKVALSQEAFALLRELRGFFAEASGIPELLQTGEVPGGVRNQGQFSQWAGIGAGRIRKMALMVEDPLGQIATKAFHLLQRHETDVYTVDDGSTFLLSQIPAVITLHVDAHSAAPIFAEQTQAKALMLQRAGAIGPDDLVELMDPPGRDELKVKAKQLAESRAQLIREQLRIQEERALRGARPGRPPRSA